MLARLYKLIMSYYSPFNHYTEVVPCICAIVALGLIPPSPGYGYAHWRGPISVRGGRGRTSAIVLSLPPVINAGTVSSLSFVWLTQWTQSKPSLKVIFSLRLCKELVLKIDDTPFVKNQS